MNILVTGDPDFISSNITEYFSFKNHSVLVFNNLETGYLHNILKNNDITFIEGNICDSNVVAEAVKGIDYVFHYATFVSVPLNCKNPVEIFNINTLGTLNVLQSSLDAGVKNVIIVSSTAVYGNNPVLPKSENVLPEPISPYAISKLDCEPLAHVFYNNHGLHTTCLRYFNVCGPRQDSNSAYAAKIPIFLSRACTGKNLVIYGDDGQMRDFVREAKHAGDGRDSMAEVETISGWWRSEVGDGLMNMQYTRGVFTKNEVCLCQ